MRACSDTPWRGSSCRKYTLSTLLFPIAAELDVDNTESLNIVTQYCTTICGVSNLEMSLKMFD